MKKLISVLVVIMMLGTQLVFAEEKPGCGTPARVFTFEELTGLSREDIDYIVIRSGVDGVGYSTDSEEIISEIYTAINTESFHVYMMKDDNSGDPQYQILFFDKNNSVHTYTISAGIVVKEKDGLTYKTSDEEELKKVVESAYNLITDTENEETFTFGELTGISAENVAQISIMYNKDERIPAVTSSPRIISDIVNSFKDMKLRKDVRDGSAGGWLYFVNFYMNDGTFVQYSTGLRIDKADYRPLDYQSGIDIMAYYHDLIKSIDSSEWAKDYILECKESGFLDDIADLNYKEPITREQFCEIIYNMIDKTMNVKWSKISPRPFRDTTNGKVYSLGCEGIVNGRGGYTFAPNDYLTREEAAVILNRAAGFMGIGLPENAYDEKVYNDEEKISDWAFFPVHYCRKLDIMTGISETEFSPKDNYTAEQAISSVMRLYNRINI